MALTYLILIFIEITTASIVSAEPNSSFHFSQRNDSNYKREYGPLRVDLSRLTNKNDTFILPSVNKQGQKIYIAISCTSNKINTTNKYYSWNDWFSPYYSFENKMINDICKENNGIESKPR